MIIVQLDKDESTTFTIKNITEHPVLDSVIEQLFRKFKLDGEPTEYGLKTKAQGILIKNISDLDKTRHFAQEEFLKDDDYYDKN